MRMRIVLVPAECAYELYTRELNSLIAIGDG